MRKTTTAAAPFLIALAFVGVAPGCGKGEGDGTSHAIVNMCLPASPSTCEDTCVQAGDILQNHCAQCHNLGPASEGIPTFDFVLDVNKLIASDWTRSTGTSTRFLVPRNPGASLIYSRPVTAADMPPVYGLGSPQLPRVPADEGVVLRHWIADCLGSDPRAAR